MFVGREEELKVLEDAYGRTGFQMVVMYGRRRVGKTSLLDRFAHGKRALYFTAQEESGIANLRRFSRLAHESFGAPATAGAFSSWSDALEYVASEAAKLDGPSLLVLDEFPYAAQADPSLPSELQIAIDHFFKGTNVTMVLCGSNEGSMEGEVLGSKSPLYGRRTAQIRLRPLDPAYLRRDAVRARVHGVARAAERRRFPAVPGDVVREMVGRRPSGEGAG